MARTQVTSLDILNDGVHAVDIDLSDAGGLYSGLSVNTKFAFYDGDEVGVTKTKTVALSVLDTYNTSKYITTAQSTSQTLGDTTHRLTKLWATDVESSNMYTVGGIALSTTFAPTSIYPATGLTTGYIPYKSATVLANSPIYTDGTNVGIGTTGPAGYKLNVAGGSMVVANGSDGYFRLGSHANFQYTATTKLLNITSENWGSSIQLGTRKGTDGSYNYTTMDMNGNVGIGNVTCPELLTLGTAGAKAGVISFAGSSTGKAILQANATNATNPTLTLPTATGTLALLTDIPSLSGLISLTALSSTATGLTYTNTTGVFSLTTGYVIPTTTEETAWNALVSNVQTDWNATNGLAVLLNKPTIGIPQTTISTSNGTINVPANNEYILSTTLTSAHTLTITPTTPTDFTKVNEQSVNFAIGATQPALTISAPTGVTFMYMDKPELSSYSMNTTYMFVFHWISATVCQVYYSYQY